MSLLTMTDPENSFFVCQIYLENACVLLRSVPEPPNYSWSRSFHSRIFTVSDFQSRILVGLGFF